MQTLTTSQEKRAIKVVNMLKAQGIEATVTKFDPSWSDYVVVEYATPKGHRVRIVSHSYSSAAGYNQYVYSTFYVRTGNYYYHDLPEPYLNDDMALDVNEVSVNDYFACKYGIDRNNNEIGAQGPARPMQWKQAHKIDRRTGTAEAFYKFIENQFQY